MSKSHGRPSVKFLSSRQSKRSDIWVEFLSTTVAVEIQTELSQFCFLYGFSSKPWASQACSADLYIFSCQGYLSQLNRTLDSIKFIPMFFKYIGWRVTMELQELDVQLVSYGNTYAQYGICSSGQRATHRITKSYSHTVQLTILYMDQIALGNYCILKQRWQKMCSYICEYRMKVHLNIFKLRPKLEIYIGVPQQLTPNNITYLLALVTCIFIKYVLEQLDKGNNHNVNNLLFYLWQRWPTSRS